MSSCSPAAHKSSDVAGDDTLVESLCIFLRAWTGKYPPPPPTSEESRASPSDWLSCFPPPLVSPLPRSFRPCEMIPALYLGSWQDVGTDVAALAQRLRRATAVGNVADNKSIRCSHLGNLRQSTADVAAPAPTASTHRLVLLVRACPLPGVEAPQLELHIARAHKSGARRTTSSASPAIQRATSTDAIVTANDGGADSPAPPVYDVEVVRLSLADLHQRLCTAASRAASSTTAGTPARTELARWLFPNMPAPSPSQPQESPPPASVYRGAVPAAFSRAEWHVWMCAAREILVDDCAACIAHVPPTWRDVCAYWRLVMPVLDTPTEPIQPYFAITTLLLHAALSLSACPCHLNRISGKAAAAGTESAPFKTAGDASMQTAEKEAEVVQSSFTATTGEREAARGGFSAAATTTSLPCAVVHCQAGKSRSVSFVAAFLLQEWMMWYRVTQGRAAPAKASHTQAEAILTDNVSEDKAVIDLAQPVVYGAAAVSGVIAAEEQTGKARQAATARRLVDTVMAHLRSRRLCVDVNVGFDAQLWAMVDSFLGTL